MVEARRHDLLNKVKATIVLAALLSVLHWTIWVVLGPSARFTVRFLTIGAFDLSLRPLLNSGTAFGLALPLLYRVVGASLTALALAIFASVLVLIPSKYNAQLFMVEMFCAAGLAEGLERLVTGFSRDYLDLGFGSIRWPTFNIYDLVIYSVLAFLYLFVLLRFFRLGPWFRSTQQREGVVGQLRDPLYENRRPLKLMLSVYIPIAAVKLVSDEVLAFIEARVTVGSIGVLAATAVGALLISGAIGLAPLILCWRAIPTRAVDVLYLRSFRLDRRGWKTVRRLRRVLGRQCRLSGVVDPDESRRWYYLLYWLANPFMFAVGDLGQVNAMRHNMFLEGDWREGVKIGFSHARVAVFDCRTVTENLVWEIRTGLEMLGPRRTLFMIPDEASPVLVQTSLAASGPNDVALRGVPPENYVHESCTIALADRVRKNDR